MSKHQTLDEYAKKTLGDSTSYAVFTEQYDETLLNPMPRILGRKSWRIDKNLFCGWDIWTGHECSFLLDSGCPISGTIKFRYNAKSEFMVESKSMKLFLNSFDMCKMGKSKQEAILNYKLTIKNSLEKCLQTTVYIEFFEDDTEVYDDNSWFNTIEDLIDREKLIIRDYTSTQNHLIFEEVEGLSQTVKYKTNSLRSRCRHTLQKDTGTAFITIKTQGGLINLESLYRHIISLRECNEFHELLAEKLFQDIKKLHEGVVDIEILLMYNRRGGLDINPLRCTSNFIREREFLDVKKLHKKTQGQ